MKTKGLFFLRISAIRSSRPAEARTFTWPWTHLCYADVKRAQNGWQIRGLAHDRSRGVQCAVFSHMFRGDLHRPALRYALPRASPLNWTIRTPRTAGCANPFAPSPGECARGGQHRDRGSGDRAGQNPARAWPGNPDHATLRLCSPDLAPSYNRSAQI
jgi:hypothetical protein